MSEKREKYIKETVDYYIYKRDRNPERCAYRVRQDWYDHQCSRKPKETIGGYGFCKQHAKQLKMRLGMLGTVATFYKYNWRHEIEEVKAVSVTDEYFVSEPFHKRERKSDYFESREEAIRGMVSKARREVLSYESKLESARETLSMLEAKYGDIIKEEE